MNDRWSSAPRPREAHAWGASRQQGTNWGESGGERVLLLAILVAIGPLLYVFTGPPHLPFALAVPHLPSWQTAWRVLNSSNVDIDLGVVLRWILAAIWALWAWCMWSITVETALTLAELATRGAAWVQSLRAALERVTLPQLRRAARGAVIASTLVQLMSRPAGAQAAGYRQDAQLVLLPEQDPTAGATPPGQTDNVQLAAVTRYLVQPGDNLWDMAQRFYGSGWDYRRIIEANVGQRMTDGNWFERSGVIQPGWVLDIPSPTVQLEQHDGYMEYVIQPHETLAGIAARLSGDEFRWIDLVARNQAAAQNDQVHFIDAAASADLVWPSGRIVVPDDMVPLTGGDLVDVVRDGASVGDALSIECGVIQAPPVSGQGAALPSAAADAIEPLPVGPTAEVPPSSPDPHEDRAQPARVYAAPSAPPPAAPSPTAVIAGLAFAAGVLAGGGAVSTLAVNRRVRRSLEEPPVLARSARAQCANDTMSGTVVATVPGQPSLRLVTPTKLEAHMAPQPHVMDAEQGASPASSPLRLVPPDVLADLPKTSVSGEAPLHDAGDTDIGHIERGAPPTSAALAVGAGSAPSGLVKRTDGVDTLPAIWVRCFGTLRVTARTGDEERVLSDQVNGASHHKPWSLLVYLACLPDGTATADKLVEVFWGEVDTEDVNRSLRVTLARLRKLIRMQVPELPAEAELVISERHGRRRLDTRYITSDVQRFEALCEAAEKRPPGDALALYEEAHALYRDDLLPDAPYSWLDAREHDGLTLRERYREAHRRVANRLASLYRQQGQLDRAVALYEWLLRAEPTLEDVARELYRCYEQRGDLASLLRTHAQLRRALCDAYGDGFGGPVSASDVSPQPHTEQVFRQVEEALRKRQGVDQADYHRKKLQERPPAAA